MSKAENVEVHPTMAEQDIFLRWVTVIGDSSLVWDKEVYGHKNSVGLVFGKQATIDYTYCLGNSFADIIIHKNPEDPEDTGMRFNVYVQKLQGIQLYESIGEEPFSHEGERPMNFQVYNLGQMVEYVRKLVE